MKKVIFFLIIMSGFLMASCKSRSPDDETLFLYARSQGFYREGRFTETARMLAGEKNFVPSLVLRGKAEYLSGNLGAAVKSLKQALALNPHNTEASLFLARAFKETGNTGEAQKLADKILGDNPFDIRVLRFTAELALERGASGEAAAAVLLNRAVEASTESALVFLDRARIRWTGGNRDGALDDLARARALLSQDSPVVKAVEKLESIISEVSL